jgi:small-conductance mechanosensitive channel
MIASWVQQLGWTKPLTGHEITAVRPSVPETPQAATVTQTVPETVAPKAPAAPSLDPEQVHQMTQGLAALRETVQQLAAGQDRMAREMARLETDLVDILVKMPEPPPQTRGR